MSMENLTHIRIQIHVLGQCLKTGKNYFLTISTNLSDHKNTIIIARDTI